MGNPSTQPVFNGMADANAAELDPTIIDHKHRVQTSGKLTEEWN